MYAYDHFSRPSLPQTLVFLALILEFSYRLPGEAMQIDRIMEAFAKHYCLQNPNLFDETDTCYLLSFSIIMLNTALHNPNVKKKITCDQFITQNRGINSGKDLPRDILVSGFIDSLFCIFTETRKNKKLPYSICMYCILDEFLTADCSCTTKYF